MGITRKLLSVTTLGAVDFRSDKERTAAYAKTNSEGREEDREGDEADPEGRGGAVAARSVAQDFRPARPQPGSGGGPHQRRASPALGRR